MDNPNNRCKECMGILDSLNETGICDYCFSELNQISELLEEQQSQSECIEDFLKYKRIQREYTD